MRLILGFSYDYFVKMIVSFFFLEHDLDSNQMVRRWSLSLTGLCFPSI